MTRLGRARPAPVPLVFLIAGVVFLPALRGEFLNWDDSVNFVANPFYRGLGWPPDQVDAHRDAHGPLTSADVAELRNQLRPRLG